ncbi:unnamed protein product [Owenia fusiformis]|uniref:Uncharacterized protein n=1 Tax=Owenia fusiformis TaxID=6347 RepID=A0A8J1TXK6_OWEFU|nr:unnamed protein product [Owenia fusiformis]
MKGSAKKSKPSALPPLSAAVGMKGSQLRTGRTPPSGNTPFSDKGSLQTLSVQGHAGKGEGDSLHGTVKGGTNQTLAPVASTKGKLLTGSMASTTIQPTRTPPTRSPPTKTPPARLDKIQKKTKSKMSGGNNLSSKQKALPNIKSEEQKFDDLIEGCLDDIPARRTTIVRLFVSSTFSDMRAERNTLVKVAYPRLKNYCSDLGLDFQVVDMRWGVTDDATNDHGTEDLCLTEIANCQRLSVGPNFVSLLGNRYGYRPIPVELTVGEYEMLQGEARELNLEGLDMLSQWYRVDNNKVPAVYILQPIRTHLKYFGDHSDDAKRKEDSAKWWETFSTIQQIVRKSAKSLIEKGSLTEEDAHKYFMAVTEMEIAKGIHGVKDVSSQALCYVRSLKDWTDEDLTEPTMHRYMECIQENGKWIVDREVEKLRDNVSKIKLPAKLGKENYKLYDVPWKTGGIDVKHKEHDLYIEEFCNVFIQDITRLIDAAKYKVETLIPESEYYCGYDEIVHHLNFVKDKTESFCGQSDALDMARKFILNNPKRLPLVIFAESGVGKTSVMAQIMKDIPNWLKKPCTRVIKFLGTTPESTNLYDVIFGVCSQLADTYDVIMEPIGYETITKLLGYFPRFLRNVSHKTKEQIVIMLDSLDQLSPIDGAHSMTWLPIQLPSNVHLIVSTLPREHGILDTLKARLKGDASLLELKPLPLTTGQEIMTKYFKKKKRTITEEQKELLFSMFDKQPSPLFLKLLLDEAALWHSYTDIDTIPVVETAKAAIDKLFTKLEEKFGSLLVSRALGYITIGLDGVSEIEIDDALSCCDIVLNDVYQYHNPPIEGIVRIPPLLWTRIHHDLKEYLIERQSYGKTTVFWYHRQFIEVARERYTQGESLQVLHKDMSKIYMNDNGLQQTITLTKRNLTIENADRQITNQPTKVGNKRKLRALVYHLLQAGDIKTLKQCALFDLRFLMTKMLAFSLKSIIQDFEDAFQVEEDKEIKVVLDCLKNSQGLLKSTSQLPIQLLARLDHADGEDVSSLLAQSKSHCMTSPNMYLVPTHPCLRENTSGEKDEKLMLVSENASSCVIMLDNGHVITAGESQSVKLWDVTSGELIKETSEKYKIDSLYSVNTDTYLIGCGETDSVCFKIDDFSSDLELPHNIIACAPGRHDKTYIVSLNDDSCMNIHIINFKDNTTSKLFNITKQQTAALYESKFPFKAMLTDDERYLVFVRYIHGNDELKAIHKQANMKSMHVTSGTMIMHALNLASPKLEITPCYRNMTNIFMLGSVMEPLRGGEIMLGFDKYTLVWNIVKTTVDQIVIREEKAKSVSVGMFRQPREIQKKCEAWTQNIMVRSPGRDIVAIGSNEGHVAVYNLKTGHLLDNDKSMISHTSKITTVTISKTNKFIATASIDGAIKLWSPKDGTNCCTFSYNGYAVKMMFTPNEEDLLVMCINSKKLKTICHFKVHALV